MRANRLTDGSILDTDTRRGRTDCDISLLFFIFREAFETTGPVCVCYVCVWTLLTGHKALSVTVTVQQSEHLFCLDYSESAPTNTAVWWGQRSRHLSRLIRLSCLPTSSETMSALWSLLINFNLPCQGAGLSLRCRRYKCGVSDASVLDELVSNGSRLSEVSAPERWIDSALFDQPVLLIWYISDGGQK